MKKFKDLLTSSHPQKYPDLMERLAATDLRIIIRTLADYLTQHPDEKTDQYLEKLITYYERPLKHEQDIVSLRQELYDLYDINI